ncbi:flagellar assembly peptidoglycan hydrolase FlgJ [Sodalis sp. dw_96]|uniref:flagellar assembly peptidoglycan hydrolase FlgJ n=1 Tax=Sodalis sp. dw_96 TaxID=2719794 RepID=UPI001BD5BC43|nr:flagellar assembly peptidoglycan hydrolase FlgJ [Sodalis sp. dw_96]
MQVNDPVDPTSAAYDANSLAKLHTAAAQSSPQALKAVAKQVEGLFVQMMLKSMREALPKGGLTDSSQADLYTSLYDQQMSQQMSSKGLGLADMMVKQLSRNGSGPDDAGITAAAGDAAKPTPMDMTILHGHAAGSVAYSPSSMMGGSYQQGQRQSRQGEQSGDNSPGGQAFTNKLTIPAMVASQQSGIPHHLILAQAALESDWGRREIPATNGKPSYNLFGIKASGDWHGKTTDVMTTEYQNGQPAKVMQRFRVYDSYLDAIKDYVHVLTDNPRYREVVNAVQPEAAAYALQRAGYATDPDYGAKLVQIISQLKNAAAHAATAYTRDIGGLF